MGMWQILPPPPVESKSVSRSTVCLHAWLLAFKLGNGVAHLILVARRAFDVSDYGDCLILLLLFTTATLNCTAPRVPVNVTHGQSTRSVALAGLCFIEDVSYAYTSFRHRHTVLAYYGYVWTRERSGICQPHFLAECCKRQLNQGSFVLLYFALIAFSWLCLVCVLSVFLICLSPVFSSVNQRQWQCIS